MKPGIHPEYRPVLFHDTSADVYFLIGSTAETDKTHTHTDGKTYPYVTLDVSSASHPVYTGEQRKTKSEGRVAGFNKRFAGFVGGQGGLMKVLASLKQAKLRHRDCQVVKRRGRLYVICKSNPRFKCVQGRPKPKIKRR